MKSLLKCISLIFLLILLTNRIVAQPFERCIIARTYRSDGNKVFTTYYTIENNTYIEYLCKARTPKYTCHYPDSTLLHWLCDSINMEEFYVTKFDFNDSLGFTCINYMCFFRKPYSFKKFRNGTKDTIFTDYQKILEHDSIKEDEYGYKQYLRLTLDSMYLRNGDSIYVIKEEQLQEKNSKIWDQHVNFPNHIYHITRKGLLYYAGELCALNIYCTTMEFIEEKRIQCSKR